MATTSENKMTGPHGCELFTKTWTPAAAPIAQVVFVHGFVEHIKRYDHVFPKFSEEGIAVFAWDQRGFGQTSAWTKSQGVTSWAHQLGDISWAIEQASLLHPGVPLYLFGHSMGGGLALAFPTRTPALPGLEKIKGVLASSPLLRQTKAVKTPLLVVRAGSVLGSMFPKLNVAAEVKPANVCRDPEIQKAYSEDPLCVQKGTFKGVADMLLGGEALMTKDYKNWPANIPLLVVHGTSDKVTEHDASAEFVDKLKADGKDATFKSFEGFYHEMHNEPGDDKWTEINSLTSWIKSKI
ncbi:Alpha/Beta hydrolase protein [Leucosporidium creatinivorum]|uniref:Alpha/Beta hydrolase protein n=1 Tax=Leucosporidium creatinivorum TaxID=106004 RepID=A0A1Y2FJR2_9BASI|nr:Alpha/Beta hydrolase protein [Leucosporidium creatinivorum]